MFGTFFKKHFALRQFYPIHKNPSLFVACQWQRDKSKPNIFYITYRSAITLLFFITWILSIVDRRTSERWPIFLTNWGYTMCTLQSLLSLYMLVSVILASSFRRLPNLAHFSLRIYPLYWIINTIATSSAFGITIIYWIVLYDSKIMVFDAINYFVHGNNSILMLIDVWIVAHPMRLLHFIYPAIFAIIYTAFSAIYYSAGGTAKGGSKCIYKIVDWGKPLITLGTCFGIILFLICIHMFVCLMAKVRITLNEKLCGREHDDIPMDTSSKSEPSSYANEGITLEVV